MTFTIELENGYALRPFAPTDAASLALNADDPDIAVRLRDGFPSPYRQEDAQWFIENVSSGDPVTVFAIANESGEAVGSIGLMVGQNIHDRSAELGYWLGRSHWRRGTVTAAVRAITRYGLERLDLLRIHAEPLLPHPASERVLEKAGFTRESVKRKSAVKNGVVRDQSVWVVLADD